MIIIMVLSVITQVHCASSLGSRNNAAQCHGSVNQLDELFTHQAPAFRRPETHGIIAIWYYITQRIRRFAVILSMMHYTVDGIRQNSVKKLHTDLKGIFFISFHCIVAHYEQK